ncbi:MAG: class I SAM-dependent methyltransferase [Opitutales bacterium]|nr:class I SAM-dependent methyltransferase [Opitutales bacterium]
MMDPEKVREFYEQDDVVIHYARAVKSVGLWKSEALLFQRLFRADQSLLEVGCGAGRIAFGLQDLGFQDLVAIDYAKKMIQVAKAIADERSRELDFRVGDATRLNFEDASFEGVIFGFNGLMQIPSLEARQKAMREICRVLKAGSLFCFTTHDRDYPKHQKYWKKDDKDWEKGKQRSEYTERGDRIGDTDWGEMFIHVPRKSEVEELMKSTGWKLIECIPRSRLAHESKEVRDFSDECLFWVARKEG